jgi:hypothetical protein
MIRQGMAAMAVLIALAGGAAALETRDFPGGRYVTGGVGGDEQAQLRQMRGEYNLRILAAQPGGDYQANGQVAIYRGEDKLVDATMAGPMMLVQLPPGSYRLRLAAGGKSTEQQVTLGRGEQREVQLRAE